MKLALMTLILGCTSPLFAEEDAVRLEPVFDYLITPTKLQFQVYSGGCTSEENFQLSIVDNAPVKLALYRTVLDYCEAHFPAGTIVSFERSALGLSKDEAVDIINPVLQKNSSDTGENQ